LVPGIGSAPPPARAAPAIANIANRETTKIFSMIVSSFVSTPPQSIKTEMDIEVPTYAQMLRRGSAD
jgi:hypothetical protein